MRSEFQPFHGPMLPNASLLQMFTQFLCMIQYMRQILALYDEITGTLNAAFTVHPSALSK